MFRAAVDAVGIQVLDRSSGLDCAAHSAPDPRMTQQKTLRNLPVKLVEHPQRRALNDELHARPYVRLSSPARISHLAMLAPETGADDHTQVAELCRHFGAKAPPAGVNFWFVDLGPCRMNWESHTEFVTYTFYCRDEFEEPFEEPVIARIPGDWLNSLDGQILVAINLALLAKDSVVPLQADLERWFPSEIWAGSLASGGLAEVWADFRLHDDDDFSRMLVRDINLDERKAGRLVQRLLEIETYRMMALLAFPLARQHAGQVARADRGLAAITLAMTQTGRPEDEHELLEQLSGLAAEVERIAAATHYRLSAARAYYALVQRRINELREQRVEGKPTLNEFMERRLAPAMRTCESLRERADLLSRRITRAANLLRTRVDVALEQQNRDLLASMNRRARLQLRLQQTVEGLSVVVLSYYSVGLVGYVFKALYEGGLAVNPDLLTGLSVPFVIAAVWFGVRWLHHAIGTRTPDD